MFMLVESLYGWLTNSLGLISDAAHMLFDSMALVIGLFASVIANWEPNQVYSYGFIPIFFSILIFFRYGRVEVVSGFINGIFLIFIAFAVLLESMERFFHPQEINTDKLLLVSTLGLVVNLIGVFAFHDLHGGGGDHGHSHSHGHSHGHGAEHEGHQEKKAKNSNLYGNERNDVIVTCRCLSSYYCGYLGKCGSYYFVAVDSVLWLDYCRSCLLILHFVVDFRKCDSSSHFKFYNVIAMYTARF
jgi:cation diffusion facilitator family transporter